MPRPRNRSVISTPGKSKKFAHNVCRRRRAHLSCHGASRRYAMSRERWSGCRASYSTSAAARCGARCPPASYCRRSFARRMQARRTARRRRCRRAQTRTTGRRATAERRNERSQRLGPPSLRTPVSIHSSLTLRAPEASRVPSSTMTRDGCFAANASMRSRASLPIAGVLEEHEDRHRATSCDPRAASVQRLNRACTCDVKSGAILRTSRSRSAGLGFPPRSWETRNLWCSATRRESASRSPTRVRPHPNA